MTTLKSQFTAMTFNKIPKTYQGHYLTIIILWNALQAETHHRGTPGHTLNISDVTSNKIKVFQLQ